MIVLWVKMGLHTNSLRSTKSFREMLPPRFQDTTE